MVGPELERIPQSYLFILEGNTVAASGPCWVLYHPCGCTILDKSLDLRSCHNRLSSMTPLLSQLSAPSLCDFRS